MYTNTIKRTIGALITISMLLLPVQGIAVDAGCSLVIQDTIAGLGTQAEIDCTATRLTITPPFGQSYDHPVTTTAGSKTVIMIPAGETRIAGQYVATVGTTHTTFTVLADKVDHAVTETSKQTLRADGQDTLTVTVTLYDKNDNPIAGNPLVLLSSRSEDSLDAQARQTDDSGKMTWIMRSSKNGIATLTPYDILHNKRLDPVSVQVGMGVSSLSADLAGTIVGGSDFGPVDHFVIKTSQDGPVDSNKLFSVVITALDKQNKIVEDYVNTVIITSSDPQSNFPKKGFDQTHPNQGQLDFRPSDLGVRSVPLSFMARTTGQQTFTVQDKDNPTVQGILTVDVRSSDGQASGPIQILSPANNSVVNKTDIVLQGRAPSLINVIVSGSAQAAGETDADGIFRINVSLDPNLHDHTLIVQSESKQYQSAPLHLVLDTTAPNIQSITFDPSVGKAGDQAKLTVLGDAGGTAKATIGTTPVTLSETSSGTYTGTFTTPDVGSYDVHVTTTDIAGNETNMLAKWTVQAKGLPQVQNVKAEGKPQAILLSWNALDAKTEIDHYNIYIGDAPDNFQYKLTTVAANTSALIKGLDPLKQYYFVVTGEKTDGTESAKSSPPAVSSPLGLKVTVVAQDSGLMLQMSAPQDLAIDKYRIELGTEPGNYVSTMTFEAAQSLLVRDLLNGVTYELRITPIPVTGKPMTELATVVHGTPSGTGFHPAAPDPIPNYGDNGGAANGGTTSGTDTGTNYPDIPAVPSTGIPTMFALTMIVVAGAAGAATLRYRKNRKHADQFLRAVSSRYHQ